MVEITDEESAEAWLKDQPHAAQVAFAARCALRVFPLIEDGGMSGNAVVLPAARAIFVAAVAGVTPSAGITRAASSAAEACDIAADSTLLSERASVCGSAAASAAAAAFNRDHPETAVSTPAENWPISPV
jgi:hypothetical protein